MFATLILTSICGALPAEATSAPDCTIHIRGDAVSIADRTVLFDDDEAKALMKACEKISIDSKEATTFHRVGDVVMVLQRNGFGKIGFITEPPPASAQ